MPSLEDTLKKYAAHSDFRGINLTDVNQRGAADDAPLHIAARKGEVEDVEVLIAHGAHISLPGDQGNTPLHFAAISGQVRVVRKLLELGASPTRTNGFSETPLQMAQMGKHQAVIEILQGLG
jgi:ankyrin repeat protein